MDCSEIVFKTLTNFAALLQHYHTQLSPGLFLQLLQAYGCAETRRARANDADVNIVNSSLNLSGIKSDKFFSVGRRKVDPSTLSELCGQEPAREHDC
jgi:hypothetical protein